MKDCVFCKIVNKKAPSTVISQANFAISILDIHPYNSGHTLIIPKQHIQKLESITSEALVDILMLTNDRIFELRSMGYTGYKVVMNLGDAMEVDHLHIHVLGLSNGDINADLV